MSFHEVLENTKIRHLDLPSPLTFDPSAAVRTVIAQMQRTHCACALVVESGKLVGVFTERDVLNKIVGKPALLRTVLNKIVGKPALLEEPVRAFMTLDPVTLATDHSLDDAVDVMSEGGYRNVPIVDSEGRPVASLSASDIVKYIVAHFPKDVYNLPPHPEQKLATQEGA